MKNKDADKLNLKDEEIAEVKRLRNKRRNKGLTPQEKKRYAELLKNGNPRG